MAKKSAAAARGRQKVHKVMKEYQQGNLKSGAGGKGGRVRSREQAVAIALSEARKSGAPIPEKPSRSRQ
jgi:hypothetical protein